MNLRECAPCFSHPLFLGQYIEDVVDSLYEKENTRSKFNFLSPQIKYRCLLVEFMKNFSENRGFSRSTLHLGVYLLDCFMDNHDISLERLNLVSMVCLLLGAKVEEMESSIPKISDIKRLTNIDCTLRDYVCLEMMVLEFLNWNVMQPTVVTYIELYIDAIISKEDFHLYSSHATDGIMFKDLKAMKSAATTIVFEFLNLTLSNLESSMECPSQLAASIVAATRYSLALDPVWPLNMTRITGYQLAILKKLVSRLFRLKNMEDGGIEVKDKRKNTPDSGYISSKDCSDEGEDDEMSDLTKRFKT